MRKAALIGALALAACNKPAPTPEPSAAAPVPVQPAAIPSEEAPVAVAPKPTPTPTPTPSPTASAKPKPLAKPEKHLQALGTEPFWSVDVMPKGRLRYSTPDMVNGVVVSSREKREGHVVRYIARLNGKPFTLEVKPVKCSDGMSDTVYPYTVTFVHSGRTDHGCARMK